MRIKSIYPFPREPKQNFVRRGESIVAGFAVGYLFYYYDILTREFEMRHLRKSQVVEESERFKTAVGRVDADLEKIKRKVSYEIDSEHSQIFGVHQVMLKDPQMLKEMEEGLKDRLVNVEHIVQEVFKRWEKKLRVSDNSITQAKAMDVADVSRRLLRVLMGIEGNVLSELPPDSIIVAKRLLPSDTICLKEENVKAILTEEGTQNSHSAILARALGIPFVAKIHIPFNLISSRTQVIVDGEQGKIIMNPTREELQRYPRLIRQGIKKKLKIVRRIRKTKLSLGDKQILVHANVSTLEDVKRAQKYGCDGIGLYRTEPLYMRHTNLVSEEYLYTRLSETLDRIRNQAVALRLLDIGGDKILPFLNIAEIKNPALGLSGIRLLLKYPNLLKMQLRVFLMLSAKFHIKILIPMVSLPKDMIEVRHYFFREKEKLRKEGIPFNKDTPLGAMIETPAALLCIDELLKSADFLSIGTNDLVQYVMAAGREKTDVAEYYEAGNRLILNSLKQVIQKAEEQGKECGICGELAGNLSFTADFIKMGLRNFSVQPFVIPHLKEKIGRILNSRGFSKSAKLKKKGNASN